MNERPFGEELEPGEVHGWRQGSLNWEEYEEGATFYRQVGKRGLNIVGTGRKQISV